ncbi:MAG: flagellar basal body rod protein FlgB [bacterium]
MFDQSTHMQTVKILENSLDTATLRQKVIADNIANVNTPGFKKSYVSFEDELALALQKKETSNFKARTTDPKHIQFYKPPKHPTAVRPRMFVEDDTTFRNDLNNVDINAEMANLAKNSIMYEAVVNRISGMFQMLDVVIRGGTR